VKPRTKFLAGGLLVLGTAGYLMATSIRDTAVSHRVEVRRVKVEDIFSRVVSGRD